MPSKTKAASKKLEEPTVEPTPVTPEITRHIYGLILYSINHGSMIQNFQISDVKNEMGVDMGDYRIIVERTR